MGIDVPINLNHDQKLLLDKLWDMFRSSRNRSRKFVDEWSARKFVGWLILRGHIKKGEGVGDLIGKGNRYNFLINKAKEIRETEKRIDEKLKLLEEKGETL